MNDQIKQAMGVLIQAAEMGQKAGAFGLADAGVIAQAVGIVSEELKPVEGPVEADVVEEDSPKPKK